MTNRQYTAGDIQVLEGLDAVRMRPGMYIGTTGIKGLHHILWEIVDNAVDEAANGFADRLSIVLNTDNSATVSDNGRGIPVDIHPQLKISGVEVVYTQLHAGGKFNNENYSYSGGLHGVGRVRHQRAFKVAQRRGIPQRQEIRSKLSQLLRREIGKGQERRSRKAS